VSRQLVAVTYINPLRFNMRLKAEVDFNLTLETDWYHFYFGTDNDLLIEIYRTIPIISLVYDEVQFQMSLI